MKTMTMTWRSRDALLVNLAEACALIEQYDTPVETVWCGAELFRSQIASMQEVVEQKAGGFYFWGIEIKLVEGWSLTLVGGSYSVVVEGTQWCPNV